MATLVLSGVSIDSMLLHSGRVFAYDLHGKCWERRSAPGASTTAIRALDAAVTAVNGGVRWLTAGRGGVKWSQWNPLEREVYTNELWVPVFGS